MCAEAAFFKIHFPQLCEFWATLENGSSTVQTCTQKMYMRFVAFLDSTTSEFEYDAGPGTVHSHCSDAMAV